MLSAGGQLFSQREKPFELTKFLEQTCPHSQSIWLRLSAGNENLHLLRQDTALRILYSLDKYHVSSRDFV